MQSYRAEGYGRMSFLLFLSHQDEKLDYADLTRPGQLNVLADHRATAALKTLGAVGQTTEFYPLPAYRGSPRDATGYITSCEIRTLRTELPGQTRSMIPSASRPTDQPLVDLLTVSGHSWSNSVMAVYASVYAKDDAALRLISVRNETKSRLFPTCTAASFVHLAWRHRFLIQLHGTLKDPNCSRHTLHNHKVHRELVSHRRHERS
jgi:hypothetical protein